MSEAWKTYERTDNRILSKICVDPMLTLAIDHVCTSVSDNTKKILDVWCGDAGFYKEKLLYWREKSYEYSYTWIDIQKVSFRNKALSLLLGKKCFRVFQKDAEKELPFHNQEFDIAIAKIVLHNFRDLPAHFGEVSRVLKQDGMYFVVILNTDYIVDKIGRTPEKWERFKYLLEKAGVSFDYYFHIRSDIVGYAEQSGLTEVPFRPAELIKWLPQKMPQVFEGYPRALKVDPFDFIAFKKCPQKNHPI